MILTPRARVLFGTWMLLATACAHVEPAQKSSAAALRPLVSIARPSEAALATEPTNAPREPAAPQDPPAPQNESINVFMADHFLITVLARDAVIAGDMGSMRKPLQALADYSYSTVAPGPWMRWMPQLQETARLTAHASTLDAAASGVATMARICAECHVATGGGPKSQSPRPETHMVKRDTLAKRMVRHMTGADELWEGLMTPSESAWKAGAAALQYAPSTTHESLPPGFVSRLLEVRQLGVDAAEAATQEQRSNVYGLLLATCADCHAYRVEHDF
jgi:mono/diheme cytochrome c family protein